MTVIKFKNKSCIRTLACLTIYRKTPFLVPGIDRFSNTKYIKLTIFSSDLKSSFNKELKVKFDPG